MWAKEQSLQKGMYLSYYRQYFEKFFDLIEMGIYSIQDIISKNKKLLDEQINKIEFT